MLFGRHKWFVYQGLSVQWGSEYLISSLFKWWKAVRLLNVWYWDGPTNHVIFTIQILGEKSLFLDESGTVTTWLTGPFD